MRKYTLASPESRSIVDLRNYRAIIESAVQEIMPAAKVRTVTMSLLRQRGAMPSRSAERFASLT